MGLHKQAVWLAIFLGIWPLAGSAQRRGGEPLFRTQRGVDQALLDQFTAKTGIRSTWSRARKMRCWKRLKSEGRNSPADLLLTSDAGRLAPCPGSRGAGAVEVPHSRSWCLPTTATRRATGTALGARPADGPLPAATRVNMDTRLHGEFQDALFFRCHEHPVTRKKFLPCAGQATSTTP